MADNVKDPHVEVLSRDVLECAQEWMKRIEVPELTYGVGSTYPRLRWQDGTVLVDPGDGSPGLHYRVTVVVEPVDCWRPGTWREVALLVAQGDQDEVWVRLQGHEAQVQSATIVEWAVKPGTGDSAWNPPQSLPHATVNTRLAGRDNTFTFPPDGAVEILSPPMGPALQTLLESFTMEVIQP